MHSLYTVKTVTEAAPFIPAEVLSVGSHLRVD
jgi:hypothetical protein